MMNQTNKYKKRVLWNVEAEKLLMKVWKQKIDMLRSTRKTSYIYEKMANELQIAGHYYSGVEVHIKIHNFTNRYKKEKREMKASGKYKSSWCHYEVVEQILGDFGSYHLTEMDDDSIMESKNMRRVRPWEPRCVREISENYRNYRNITEEPDLSDAIVEKLDSKKRQTRTDAEGEENSADLTNIFSDLLGNPDCVGINVKNEPLNSFSEENTANDVPMNESSNSSEDIGAFKNVDVLELNDSLKQTNLSPLKENSRGKSTVLDKLAVEKAKKEIEIIKREHYQRLKLKKIEHTRRLEIMNKEHELTVQKLKLEIELLKKN